MSSLLLLAFKLKRVNCSLLAIIVLESSIFRKLELGLFIESTPAAAIFYLSSLGAAEKGKPRFRNLLESPGGDVGLKVQGLDGRNGAGVSPTTTTRLVLLVATLKYRTL